jgi:hypothetical protein
MFDARGGKRYLAMTAQAINDDEETCGGEVYWHFLPAVAQAHLLDRLAT